MGAGTSRKARAGQGLGDPRAAEPLARLAKSEEPEIKQEAIRLGFKTLRMSALNKVKEGMTNLAEAVGNTAPDRF